MRKSIQFLGIILLLSISSCSEYNCIDDITGLYVGNESCQIGQLRSITFGISPIGVSDNIRISVDGSSFTFDGKINPDCNSITVSNQSVTTSGFTFNVNGSLDIDKNNLTGTLTYSTGETCSYDLNLEF